MFSYIKGNTLPLGSNIVDDGVNFSVFSEHATGIALCLFDEEGERELQRIPFFKDSNHSWSVKVLGLSAGAKYCLRVRGPYKPDQGLYFDETKLLVDPYARMVDRNFTWSKTKRTDQSDSSTPRCVVTPRKSVQEIADKLSRKPNTPWGESIIYEAHVRGMTELNKQVPEELRGTYLGLAHQSNIDYLKELGITAIELLPVHLFIDEQFLFERKLSNYWGYNTLNFFCPHLAYSNHDAVAEFADMVEAFHSSGIEVILDVVYNHTAEADAKGPTLSFKGIDSSNYYRLTQSEPRRFINDTGCGNTVQVDHPRVLQLVMDSLRFWAGEMGVDGFRFDLASILGRDKQGFSQRAAFFQAVEQDPILSTCKLIAEPWDIGPGGYQLGAYPGAWSEWNDKYRDVCRRFWRGEGGLLSEFAKRLHGSSDKFEHNGRGTRASINFITSHDGFTLADLVSYKERHNEANTENNADGHHANFSDNYGVEGPTQNPKINALRRRQQKNLIATLFLSQGTPMLLGGDELGRSQGGNNNAYCQDNEINWIDWAQLSKDNDDLRKFTRRIIALRKELEDFFPDNFIHNHNESETGLSGSWLSRSGDIMKEADWHQTDASFIAWMINSRQESALKRALFVFNASASRETFDLPAEKKWNVLIDTANDSSALSAKNSAVETSITVQPRSVVVLAVGMR